MKVYNSITIDMNTGETISENSFDYEGPMVLCGSGGGGSTNTIEKQDPWSGQQPYLTDVFTKAQSQNNTAVPSYYPWSTVTPFSPETEQALAMQTARAINGSPVMNAGNQQLTDTLNGDYLTSNPAFAALQSNANGDYLNGNQYIDPVVDRALGKVRNSLDSQFASGGRYGSGLHKTALAGAYGDTAASMYGQNYANERQNQLGATAAMGQLYGDERQKQLQGMLFAPQMANQEYVDSQQLANVGDTRDSQAQAELTDKLNRWNFDQNKEADALARYAQLIQGNYGGSSTGTSTAAKSSNKVASTAGGALGGAYLGSQYGSSLGPWGTAGGAAVGGLLGYLAG